MTRQEIVDMFRDDIPDAALWMIWTEGDDQVPVASDD